MMTYTHLNSAADVPELRPEAHAIYLATMSGEPMPRLQNRRQSADDFRQVAARLECDELAETLRGYDVDAKIPDRDCATWSYHPVAIFIYDQDPEASVMVVDAEFAQRMVDRIRSGLSAADSYTMTYANADHPKLIKSQFRARERNT